MGKESQKRKAVPVTLKGKARGIRFKCGKQVSIRKTKDGIEIWDAEVAGFVPPSAHPDTGSQLTDSLSPP